MPPTENQPDAGRITRLCLLAWMAGAFIFALLIPLFPTYHGGLMGDMVSPVPGGPIRFGSPEHLVMGAVLVLVVGPAAGVLTARLIRKWPSSGAPE